MSRPAAWRAAGDSPPEEDVFLSFFNMSSKRASNSLAVRRRKRRTAVLLMGTMALGVCAIPAARGLHARVYRLDAAAIAETEERDPALSDAQKLAKGVDQFTNKQYEESVATLQTVSADNLNDDQKKQLNDTLAKASSDAASRKAARAEFELGEQSL